MGFAWPGGTSRRERARQEEKFRRRMFPFGEEQREAELRLLRGLIGRRAQDSELLFQLLSAKSALCPDAEEEDEDGPDPRQDALRDWLRSQLARGFAPAARAVFWALAELEQPMQALSELPGPEAVRRRAGELLRDHPALLKK